MLQEHFIYILYQKEYALIQNALTSLIAEHEGAPFKSLSFVHQQWNHADYFDVKMFAAALSKHLKYIDSGSNTAYSTEVKMCMPFDTEDYYRWANSAKQTFWNVVSYWWKLSDGSCLAINKRGGWTWTDDENGSVLIYIDINGSGKKPNQFGKDTFVFKLRHSGKLEPYPPLGVDGEYGCKKRTGVQVRGLDCVAKIIGDGWQIKDDYMW